MINSSDIQLIIAFCLPSFFFVSLQFFVCLKFCPFLSYGSSFFRLCGLLLLRRLFYFRPLIYVVLPFVYITVLRSFSVISFTNDMIGTISLLHFLLVVHYDDSTIDMQATASLRLHVRFAAACSLRVQSLTFPRLLVLLFLPHPTNLVSFLSIKHFLRP